MLPVFCALLLVIIDFGYLFYVQLSLETAARQGAHAGIYDGTWTATQIQDIMLECDGRLGTDASRHMARSEITVTLRAAGADPRTTFPTVEIQVAHTHAFLVPFGLANIVHSATTTTLTAHIWAVRVPGLVVN